jgi:hypothetical protein
LVLVVDFKPFHNFDFAPGKIFVQKKSHRLLLREAVQRADNKPSPVRGDIFVEIASQKIFKLRQERHIPPVHRTMSLLRSL